MPTWNIARYRQKAVSCAREFLALYPVYPDSIEALRRWIIEAGPDCYWACVKEHETHLCDVMFANPARTRAALERFRRQHAGSHEPSADVRVGMLILAGWQIYRKAVLQYDRIARSNLSVADKISTSYKITALVIARERVHGRWTHWPPQWGSSPFACDRRRAAMPVPDYIPEIDGFKPSE